MRMLLLVFQGQKMQEKMLEKMMEKSENWHLSYQVALIVSCF